MDGQLVERLVVQKWLKFKISSKLKLLMETPELSISRSPVPTTKETKMFDWDRWGRELGAGRAAGWMAGFL